MRRLSEAAFLAVVLAQSANAQLRPPAVPLIAHDPYFSVWSFSNGLADGATRHWTGAEQPLTSVVRIDGAAYRLMGTGAVIPPALPQTGLRVWPTRTVYAFAGAGVELHLTFATPSLPDDVDVLSRPATYLTWDVRATDGKAHDVQAYFGADARLAVDTPEQNVVWGRLKGALSIGSEEQPVLQKRGDNRRIDWGHLLVAGGGKGYVGTGAKGLAEFVRGGTLPGDERSKARPAGEDVVAAFAMPFGKVGATPVARHLVVAYDDGLSIQFMGHDLRPYWRRNGMDGAGLLAVAERDYARLSARCEAFDRELTDDLTRVGGADYAAIASLAYRQSLAAQKVVADAKGQPLMFSKGNFSNGCIATVDILYPESPELLLFSPTLMKATLVPVLEYASSSRWKWPFAPHDLGQYPKANGQVYGGGERTENDQMPVEETGNLILVLAALAKAEGNANFSATYWPQLSKWAAYLADKGFDPESQLSTDDFAGHLAHNVNLSAKAIEALGAYATLADTLGKKEEAAKYRTMAKGFADRWVREAAEGDHYKLAFDRAGTWSQEVQPRVGPHPRPGPLPPLRGAEGDGVLPDQAQRLRPSARQPRGLHEARLGGMDGDVDGRSQGLRGDRGPHRPLPRRHDRPGADDGLVLDLAAPAARLPGPLGGGRRVREDAGRPVALGEVRRARPDGGGPLGAAADAAGGDGGRPDGDPFGHGVVVHLRPAQGGLGGPGVRRLRVG